MLHSENIPDIPFKVSDGKMGDIFRNFAFNWDTLSPALWLLFGTLFGFFILKLLKDRFGD
ncbi:hypothetical protein [Heyndrickxia oleronia]|uniref:hypothetical protein n=1 Tax=Heyndrickxia oleronia TaxID=38875 RepID=UPI0037539937